ncbi:MAG: right-handed parallel beta-helix repeat-containing protein [Chitinophagaceae bacterium]
MIKRILPFILFVFCAGMCYGQEKPLVAGMKILRTMKIKKAVYQIEAPADTAKPVLFIEGDNITIDFNNAEMNGSNRNKNPEEFSGVAILIRNSKNVTIRNLKARGYKIALLARNVEKLTLDNCDFSYNYRQHLNSTQEKEDVSDWMSYHHNENDEWLRYGAAMYLRGCNFLTIKNCKVTGGQNALMLMECNDGMIYNNDFSFNSGIGIGMYQSNRNSIMYNRVVFNVRGYSYGVYNRGQDSAGMLVYEQSSNNLFYKNNVTHGGDGFFLWAGQTTMDSGKGGCNDNIIMSNDFSYAPTNGIEATFSRNIILSNKIFECDHGIWGGYSYNTTIAENQFRNNRIAIAIEHGQYNNFHHNLFIKDKEAVRLWARPQQPENWGYAKYRNTRSVGYVMSSNSFNDHQLVYNITRTDSLNIFDNTYSKNTVSMYKTDSSVTNLDTLFNQRWSDFFSSSKDIVIPQVDDPMDPFEGYGKLSGKKNILITEWGPYDFRSPIIWNTNPTDTSTTMKFDLIGTNGKWKVKSYKGVENLSAMSGVFPATITAQKIEVGRADIAIELEYTGDKITTPFGERINAGKAYNFSYRKFFQPLNWEVLFYALDTTSHDPIKTGQLFSVYEKKAPFKRDSVDRLEYAWWGGIKANGINYPQFITVATTSAILPKGEYELSVTWDDAVRIFIDDKLIVDEWEPYKFKFDESPNRRIPLIISGKHQFRVEHLELGGFATLNLKMRLIK